MELQPWTWPRPREKSRQAGRDSRTAPPGPSRPRAQSPATCKAEEGRGDRDPSLGTLRQSRCPSKTEAPRSLTCRGCRRPSLGPGHQGLSHPLASPPRTRAHARRVSPRAPTTQGSHTPPSVPAHARRAARRHTCQPGMQDHVGQQADHRVQALGVSRHSIHGGISGKADNAGHQGHDGCTPGGASLRSAPTTGARRRLPQPLLQCTLLTGGNRSCPQAVCGSDDVRPARTRASWGFLEHGLPPRWPIPPAV